MAITSRFKETTDKAMEEGTLPQAKRVNHRTQALALKSFRAGQSPDGRNRWGRPHCGEGTVPVGMQNGEGFQVEKG